MKKKKEKIEKNPDRRPAVKKEKCTGVPPVPMSILGQRARLR